MKFLLLTFIVIFSSLSLSAQLVKIDVEMKTSNLLLNPNPFPIQMISSDEANKIYCLFPKKRNKRNTKSYDLHILNEKFEVEQVISEIIINNAKVSKEFFSNKGMEFRGGFVKNEALYIPVYYQKFRNNCFSFSRRLLNKPKEVKETIIKLSSEILLAADLQGDFYYVVTLSKDGILKIFDINIESLKGTESVIEGDYKKVYNLMNSFNVIGSTQIDDDKYYDLQTTSSRVKSYFRNGKYILETFGDNQNTLRCIDLKTGEIITKKIENIRNDRASILFEDKYYVSEVVSNSMGLKIYDFETAKLLKRIVYNPDDKSIPFQSTAVMDDKSEIVKPKKIIRKFGKTNNQSRSFGIIPEKVDNTILLTLGAPRYSGSYNAGHMSANGTMSGGGSQSLKFTYEYGNISPKYDSEVSFESWIKEDGTIVPYDGKAKAKSNYSRVIRGINRYNEIMNYSKPTVFKFNNEWYFGIYNEIAKQYLIYLM